MVKEYIDTNRTDREVWDVCSVFLGFGNVLVWIGMLRYLEYFQDYNVNKKILEPIKTMA